MSKTKEGQEIEKTANLEISEKEYLAKGYHFVDEKKEHMHVFNGKPLIGTSTVCGVLAKPLTWWASGMAVSVFGWLNPKNFSPVECSQRAQDALETIKTLDVENYLALLKKAYYAHSEKKDISAEEGTDMHSLLESYVKSCLETNKGIPLAHSVGETERVSEFVDWSLENVKRFIYSEAHVYSEIMWTGGIFDVCFEMKDGKTFIGDFKSSKEAYLSQFLQIAGYDIQLIENGALDKNGKSLSTGTPVIDGYVVFPFGAKKFEPAFRFNMKELSDGFKSALVLYKLTNQ